MSKLMAVLAAFSTLILATPALAGDRHKIADAPCDAEGPFDGAYDPVAFAPGHNYFPDDQQALPDGDEQAAPDADDSGSADNPDGDEDAAPDGEGCAEIMVTPYDFLIRPPEHAPEPVLLQRRLPVMRDNRA